MSKVFSSLATGYIAIVLVVGMWGLFFTPAPLWTKVLFVIGVVGLTGFVYEDFIK